MSERITNKTAETERYPGSLPHSLQNTVWIAIIVVLVISLLDLTGWITGITWLKSGGLYWSEMKIIVALCFVFTSIALAIILIKRPVAINITLPVLTGIFLILMGLLTIFCWLYVKGTGREVLITVMPVLNLFLSPETRMALLSAFLFLLTGIILILLTLDSHAASNIAHTLFFPVAVASYIVPVSYLLNVSSMHQIFNSPEALNSGIAFCAICVAVYMMRPYTWLMRVFTSSNTGGIMARRLLPWLIILPVVIGWLRINGEHSGFFVSEVGVLLVAITYTFCFILLVWFTARSVNQIDRRRLIADEALKKAFAEMEDRVRERTAELLNLNRVLDEEIKERIKAEEFVESEHKRMNNLLEQRVAERTAELSMANDLLRTSQKIAHLGSWELDTVNDVLTWSDEVYSIFGVRPEEFDPSYKAFLDIIHPDDINLVDKAYQDSIDEGRDNYAIGHRIIQKNTGEIRHLHEKCKHIRNGNGEIIRSIGMVHDVTENKWMELALQRNNERLDILSHTSSRLLASENPQDLIDSLCIRVMKFIDCQIFLNFFTDEIKGKLHLNSYAGIPENIARKIEWLDFGVAMCGCVARDGTRKVEENIFELHDPGADLLKSFGIRAYACHPLLSKDEAIGTLSFGTSSRTAFSEDDLSLMKTIADLVAIALTRVRNEDSLRKSEERYRSLMELSPGASFVIRNNSIVLLNSAARKLLGVSSVEAVLGKSPLEIFHPDYHTGIKARIEKILKGGSVPMAVEQIVRADGIIRDVEAVAARITDSEGPAIQVIMSDITERKKAEKELFDTKNYLENLIDYANAPIIVWDHEKIIRLFNHAFEHLTGYTSSEVEGKKLDLLFPGDSFKESMTKIKHALTENWETIEIPILTKSKDIRTVLWNSAKIYDKSRKTFSTIAQGNDITQRIEAERAFKASKEKLDIALETGKIGIWEWDIGKDIIKWDKRMERMFGWVHGLIENTFEAFEKSIHEEDLQHVRNAFGQALKGDCPLATIYRIKHNNGDINYISTKALVEKDKSGNPVKMSGVCFDITDMKRGAEKVLFRLNEDLLRSNKELEQFAYVASHDLQEPLRMVSSFTQLLSQRYKDKLDQDAQEFIQFAVDGAVRMQGLINDLLDYSRVETRGKKFSTVDMHYVLGQVMNTLKINIQEKNAMITNDEIPSIFADEGQMVQLLQNLIGNSLKFCKTSPRIHISAREETDHYLFSVNDNGIGIEAEYFNRIFQIFQRLHAKDEYEGTGIGLAICKRIVERHGGKIWVESKPDKGSEFNFTITKRQLIPNHENFTY